MEKLCQNFEAPNWIEIIILGLIKITVFSSKMGKTCEIVKTILFL